MVFVGPSGCAKSTLLRMVAGLESISGGELRIGDRVVNNVAAKERGVPMVFQNYALYPHMTAYDILQGVELDANPDGSLPLDDATLGWFDFVIVSFPANGGWDPQRLTNQIVRAAANPHVAILGKPMGEFMLQGAKAGVDMWRVLEAAAEQRTGVEVTANPCCAELDWSNCKLAQEMGVYMAISPDAHRAARLVDYRHGTEMARSAGVCCGSVLNTMDHFELRRYLMRGR